MALTKVLPLSVFLLWIAAIGWVQAQTDVPHIQVSDSLLRKHVYFLASDSLQGRATGTAGQRAAANYCTQTLRHHHASAVFRLPSGTVSFQQRYRFRVTEATTFGGFPYRRFQLLPSNASARDSAKALEGHNVAGLLAGTDLKQEVVVLSAHYDHLGRDKKPIFYGADDNASGTAALLSIAYTLDSLAQRGIRSRRSIMLVFFSGEEGGLIGSQYFVDHSPIPINQLVGNLNVDMVGRVDSEHNDFPFYCYLIDGGHQKGMRQFADSANSQTTRLKLDYSYNSLDDPHQYFYRSDQFNFARLGIPVLFFTNGLHDDYHRPTDTADKIRYDVLQKRATLVFQTAWLLANYSP